MKINFRVLVVGLLLLCPVLNAAEAPASEAAPVSKSLEDQLSDLGTPGNEAPVGLTSEQLYAVQNRFSSLRHRSELTIGGGNNFSTNSFLLSQSLDSTYRFYLSDRWYLGLSGSVVFNRFTDGGQWLIDEVRRAPDVAVTKFRTDLQLGYNLFYGKFRLTMDRVFYFDQYVALGPGLLMFDKTRNPAAGNRASLVADVGFAFWFGRNLSFRLGVKDYFFHEQRSLTSGWVNNFSGYLQAGYVFGG